MVPKVFAIIGRGYGDEGKGLATDYVASSFCAEGSALCKPNLVIRHNGGAQSGHTVEKINVNGGTYRFVFHELSSGSFSYSDTLWARTFLPDLFKLSNEINDLKEVLLANGYQASYFPRIFAEESTNITLIDDVLINMILEEARGANRHGSCGMGINEADLRIKAGYSLSISEVKALSLNELFARLKSIREEYSLKRLSSQGFNVAECSEPSLLGYFELLLSDTVLENFAMTIKKNSDYVEIVPNIDELFSNYSAVIFESGQGLLLDAECRESEPYVTASKTGLTNIVKILADTSYSLDEAIYVSRSYVTKHGAGPLKCECTREELGRLEIDRTNQPNPWQGSLRYAYFESPDAFFKPIDEDLASVKLAENTAVSLFLTHLDETDGKLMFAASPLAIGDGPFFTRMCTSVRHQGRSFLYKDVYFGSWMCTLIRCQR